MSENNEEFEPFDEDEGIVSFAEFRGIAERHIDEGNKPYTDDQFLEIMTWAEETRFNESILNLVLEGRIDIIFDHDRDDVKEGELVFQLTRKGIAEMEVDGYPLKKSPPPSIMPKPKFDGDDE